MAKREETGRLPEPEGHKRRLATGYFGTKERAVIWVCPHGLSMKTVCEKCDKESGQ